MTVFNAFLKVIRKNIGTIILYTIIVIVFAAVNMQTSDNSGEFVSEKPKILIENHDSSPISQNLVKYLTENTEVKEISGGEEAVSDALFYREISCVVTIPQNYGTNTMTGKEPEILIKATGDYHASFVEIMLTHYIRIQNTYAEISENEKDMVKQINSALDSKTEIEMTSELDTVSLTKAKSYFNFAAYSIMSCIIFIICLVLSSFNHLTVRKRTIVSSMNDKKYNAFLLISSSLYVLVVWLFFAILGYVMVGDIVFTPVGGLYILNMLIFALTSLSIAYFLSTVIHAKNAITGIVNVITLGFSFLCGVFVPMQYLPSWVISVAHILPAYWYVDTNNRLADTEILNIDSLTPILINMLVLAGFFVLFAISGIIVSKKKQKIA